MKTFLTSAILAVFCVCATASPNLLFIEMDGVKARGNIYRKYFRIHQEINLIEVNPRKLSNDQLLELWVELEPTYRSSFAELSESILKKIGTLSTVYYPSLDVGNTYYLHGYSFKYEDGQLVGFVANRYGFPPKKNTPFVKLGSRKTGASLSLPCSVDEFGKVFGRVENVSRGFSW